MFLQRVNFPNKVKKKKKKKKLHPKPTHFSESVKLTLQRSNLSERWFISFVCTLKKTSYHLSGHVCSIRDGAVDIFGLNTSQICECLIKLYIDIFIG